MSGPDHQTVSRRPPWRGLVAFALVLLVAGGAWLVGTRPDTSARGAAARHHVEGFVKFANSRRVVVETQDGTLVTLEIDRGRLAGLDLAHMRAHAELGRAMRLGYRVKDRRSWLVDTRDAPGFAGVTSRPARTVTAHEVAAIRVDQSREEVLDRLGPALVPGFGDLFEGRRADCWQWRMRDRDRRFVACFDTTSDPHVIGTFTRRIVDAS